MEIKAFFYYLQTSAGECEIFVYIYSIEIFHILLPMSVCKTLWETYGVPLGNLWGTFRGHLRHFRGHMGHLWGRCETLCGTYGVPFGDI